MERRRGVWLVALILGCGPAVDEDENSTGSGTSGASSGAESSSSGADSTGGEDTGGLCPQVQDGQVPNLLVPIEITNTLASTVYVGYESECTLDLFKILRPDGSPVEWHGRTCTPSCEQVLDQECFDCGACAGVSMMRIGPGATHTFAWTPAEYDLLDFPLECDPAPCSSICDRRRELVDGEYTFEFVASTDCDGDGMTCDCWNGEESCEVYPWSWPEPSLSASVQVTVPTSTISVTIE